MTLQTHEVHHLQDSQSPSSQDARVFEVADAQITRSASSGQLESLLNRSVTTIRRTWSESVLAGSWRSSGDLDQTPVVNHEGGAATPRPRSATTSTVAASGFIPGPPSNTQDDVLEIHIQAIDPKRSSMSQSLSRLARPSWLPSSRSPSPSPSVRDHHQGSHRSKLGEEPPLALPSLSGSAIDSPNLDRPSKPRIRPLSTFIGKSGPIPTAHPIPNATAKLYHIDTKSSKHPPRIPRSLSSDRLQHLDAAAPRKRDSLSSTFKALDADFQKQVSHIARLEDRCCDG